MIANEYEAEAGENIYSFVERVKRSMYLCSQSYAHCVFNDIRMGISNDSNVNDICTIYDLKCQLRQTT